MNFSECSQEFCLLLPMIIICHTILSEPGRLPDKSTIFFLTFSFYFYGIDSEKIRFDPLNRTFSMK